MDPYSQEYMDLYTYVASLTPQVYKAMKAWEKKRLGVEKKMAQPCAAKQPCAPKSPCAPKAPCAPKKR